MVYTGLATHENEILNKTEPFTFVHLDQSHHQREGELKYYLQYSRRDYVYLKITVLKIQIFYYMENFIKSIVISL